MADTKQIDWGDGSGEKITVTASSFVGNKGLQIQSPENVKVTSRSKTIVLKSKTDPTKVARINVTQEKAVYTYDFILTTLVPSIAAKGGDSVITAQLKTYRNGNLVETKAVTPTLSGSGTGFSISGTTVTASNRTTVVGAERSITVTGKFTGTFDGQEVTATVVVKQEANTATYGEVSISGGTVSDIPASGGSISSVSGISAAQTVSFTSGSTRDGAVTISYSSAVTASSLGTTVKVRTKIGTLVATASGEGGKSVQKSFDVYQQANSADEILYGVPDVSVVFQDIPASGGSVSSGTVTYSQSRTQKYTSGSTVALSPVTSGGSVSYSSPVSAPSLGTTVKSRTAIDTITVTVELNGQTGSAVEYVYQQANSLTWNNPVISYSYSDIAASGGTVTPSLSITQSGSYTSGSTATNTTIGSKSFSGTGVNTSTGAYTASSLGTTVKARTKLSTGTVTVTANGKSASEAADIYQAENKIEGYNYGTWTIAISANPTTIAYGGGNSAISASCTRSKTPVYSSGATGSAGSESVTPTLSGSATGFTLSGTTVTASANSWAATRSITVTASYSGATSKSVTITQAAAPASISLNKTTIAFSQRASSNTVQVTCNSDWDVNSNAEFAIPETLQIKYNPSTDVVELVDQPIQIIKKVQESDEYVLALVRIGAHQNANNYSGVRAISREAVRAAKNTAGYKNRMQQFLVTKQQDKAYHRIVGRQWFRNGNATSQTQAGVDGRPGGYYTPQASLFPASTLISKPGVKLGIRGCELSVPLVHVAEEELGSVRPCNGVVWNAATGRVTCEMSRSPRNGSVAQPRLAFVAATSNNGPLGYILFKKKSTTQYLDVHGWEEISNFTLARVLSDISYIERTLGANNFEVVVTFQYGEP